MVYCTDLNLPIKLKTIVLLFQVTPSQTDPKLVWIIGNLRLDKLVYHVGMGTVLIDLWRMKFQYDTDGNSQKGFWELFF